MSYTENWNIEIPVEGALDWNISLNNNFGLIDSILQSLRTNYSDSTEPTGPTEHNEVGSLWYSMLDNPGEGLFVRKTTGLSRLIDEYFADSKYLKKNGDTFNGIFKFGINGHMYFYNATTEDFARLILFTYNDRQSLKIEFGTSSDSAVRFVGNNGSQIDVMHIYMDRVKSFKPIETIDATQDQHVVTKKQLDEALNKIAILEARLLAAGIP